MAIKVRLAELELSVAGLARRLGWTRVYVSMLIHGDRVTPAAQRRIAAALRMPVDRAFPRKP